MTDQQSPLHGLQQLRDRLITLKQDRSTYIKSRDVLIAYNEEDADGWNVIEGSTRYHEFLSTVQEEIEALGLAFTRRRSLGLSTRS